MTGRLARVVVPVVLLIAPLAAAQEPPALPAASQPPPPPSDAAPPPETARYLALVKRVKAGDATVDLAEVREAFSETSNHRGTMMTAYQPLWSALAAGDFAAALETAEAVLQVNYIEINAHMVSAVAHQRLGNTVQATYHRNIADGLLRVVMSKGDGLSPETAWEVIDIIEEYAVMRALNVTPRGQALLGAATAGPKVDVMTVLDNGTQQERKIYFNVDRFMAAQRRQREQAGRP